MVLRSELRKFCLQFTVGNSRMSISLWAAKSRAMRFLSATAVITLSLAALCVTALLTGHLLGMIPNPRDPVMRGRGALCESLAINLSLMAQKGDTAAMQAALGAIKERNQDITSIAVRLADGSILFEVGEHSVHWKTEPGTYSSDTQMFVPISNGSTRWGTVEVGFTPLLPPGWRGVLLHPVVLLSLFMAGACSVAFYGYLSRVLQQLNPKKVVPPRVKSALDTLAEGLLLLDGNGRIVLANQSFSETCGHSLDELLGKPVDSLTWREPEEHDPNSGESSPVILPWTSVLLNGQAQHGRLLRLDQAAARDRTFVVNASPVLDDKGGRRGCIASFEDVTKLQQKKVELAAMLETLRSSADRIRQQNRELERLATMDALTGCFNRRYFFERFDNVWADAQRGRQDISVIMIDIDHFKSINDKHGHGTGDEVLQRVGRHLNERFVGEHVAARYGGEEFAILLPNSTVSEAAATAEQIRRELQSMKFDQLSLTASLGVSSVASNARSPQELLEQADKCLYVAKRNGRNRVERYDEVPEDLMVDEAKLKRVGGEETSQIPFPAVTALISALAYRDSETAAHSRRVADLCVAVGQGLMSMGSCDVLETAAILHDIGKIGVPDSILLKPTALTEEEWELMRQQDRIGLEILRASFGSEEMSEIVENYSCHYSEGLDRGIMLPLGARILAIADAYDSMVTDRVYRAGRSSKAAFEELRRCAGSQFDPELVERFIGAVTIARRQQPQSLTVPIAKELALGIGLELERLAAAVDRQDLPGLKAMASRLAATAARAGAPEIAGKALELETSAEENQDILGVLRCANELLAVCRSTQGSYLQASLPSRREEVTADA